MPENAPPCALTPDPRSLQVRTASSLDIARNAQPFDSPRLARTAFLDTPRPTMASSSQETFGLVDLLAACRGEGRRSARPAALHLGCNPSNDLEEVGDRIKRVERLDHAVQGQGRVLVDDHVPEPGKRLELGSTR